MKEKILYISDVPDFKGGAERSLFDLMASPHIEPILCVPEHGEMSEAAKEKGIAVETIEYGLVRTIRRPLKIRDVFRTLYDTVKAAQDLKRVAKKNNVLCVHTNGLKAHYVACFSRLIGGPKAVAHFRAIPFTILERIYWTYVRLLSSQVIVVSRPCWPDSNLPSNVQVIFNAINLPEEDNIPRPSEKPPFRLGFAGRIQYTKGVDSLIQWFDYALKKGLDITLNIRGEAAPDELDYDAKCRSMVKERGLQDRIIFEGRVKTYDKIFGNIHANVVSSVVPDPLPRSVMEACAFGIPVIGYPAGGIPYMFEDGKSGLLVKDGESFYQAVRKMIEDDAFYQSLKVNAVENAKEKFAMPRLHKDVYNVYQKLK